MLILVPLLQLWRWWLRPLRLQALLLQWRRCHWCCCCGCGDVL